MHPPNEAARRASSRFGRAERTMTNGAYVLKRPRIYRPAPLLYYCLRVPRQDDDARTLARNSPPPAVHCMQIRARLEVLLEDHASSLHRANAAENFMNK